MHVEHSFNDSPNEHCHSVGVDGPLLVSDVIGARGVVQTTGQKGGEKKARR